MAGLLKVVLTFFAAFLTVTGFASAQQELRVGLMDEEPGVVRKSDQLSGRDIDVWNAIARDTGLRVSYVFVRNPSALLTALDEGKTDVAGWTSTTAAKYLLTVTILPTAEALLVPKTDPRRYRLVEDIKHLKFATLTGSAYANYLKKIGVASVSELASVPEVLSAVTSGRADAAMFSGIIAGYMEKQGRLPDLHVVRSYEPALSRPVVAAFPQNASEMYERVNASLKRLHANGTIDKIKAEYGL